MPWERGKDTLILPLLDQLSPELTLSTSLLYQLENLAEMQVCPPAPVNRDPHVGAVSAQGSRCTVEEDPQAGAGKPQALWKCSYLGEGGSGDGFWVLDLLSLTSSKPARNQISSP